MLCFSLDAFHKLGQTRSRQSVLWLSIFSGLRIQYTGYRIILNVLLMQLKGMESSSLHYAKD